jgi:hypothetical protein
MCGPQYCSIKITEEFRKMAENNQLKVQEVGKEKLLTLNSAT